MTTPTPQAFQSQSGKCYNFDLAALQDHQVELTIRQMRAELGRLDQILASEGEVVVTRRGKPIARIVPVRSRPRPDHADLRSSIPPLQTPSEDLLREERESR